MSKTIVQATPSVQVVHDSDGKSSPLSTSAGQPVVIAVNTSGKTIAIHGQITNTSVVANNPA